MLAYSKNEWKAVTHCDQKCGDSGLKARRAKCEYVGPRRNLISTQAYAEPGGDPRPGAPSSSPGHKGKFWGVHIMPVRKEDNTALVLQLKQSAIKYRAALYRAGVLLDAVALCERMGIGHDSLKDAVRETRLFYLEGSLGARWYPSFFAYQLPIRQRIEQVSVRLGALRGDAKWVFFTRPKHSLSGLTPLRALELGDLACVLRCASQYRERILGR